MKPLWKVMNIYTCPDTYTFIHIHIHTHTYTYTYTYTCWRRREKREETNRTLPQLIPSAVSLKIAETEQLYQAQRKIGGIGNVLLSTYSQTENG